MEIAGELGIETCQFACRLEDLFKADEVILAGTTTEAVSVTEIDEKVIGTGSPGVMVKRIRRAFLNRC